MLGKGACPHSIFFLGVLELFVHFFFSLAEKNSGLSKRFVSMTIS